MCSCFISASAALERRVQQPFKTKLVRRSWFCGLMVFWTRSTSKIKDKFVSCSCTSSLHSSPFFSFLSNIPAIFVLSLVFSVHPSLLFLPPCYSFVVSLELSYFSFSCHLIIVFLLKLHLRFSLLIFSPIYFFFFIPSSLSSIIFYSFLLFSSFSTIFLLTPSWISPWTYFFHLLNILTLETLSLKCRYRASWQSIEHE
jgi:hypothetical protein